MSLQSERELSNLLEDEFGWAAMPAGGSGGGTQRPRPDIIAARSHPIAAGSEVVVIEEKAWTQSGPTGRLDAEEVTDLLDFARRAHATAVVAIRPNFRRWETWHLYRVGDLNETPGGNFSIREDDVPGQTPQEVFG